MSRWGNVVVAHHFGFAPRSGAQARGDGNGLIQDATGAVAGQCYAGEALGFWADLGDAGLVEANPPMAASALSLPANVTYGFTLPYLNQYVMVSRLNSTIGWFAYSYNNQNYLLLAQPYQDSSVFPVNSLTPAEAYYIDTKVDDGLPTTGIVTGIGGDFSLGPGTPTFCALYWCEAATIAAPAPAAAGLCVTSDPGNPYNMTYPDTPACSLHLQLQ